MTDTKFNVTISTNNNNTMSSIKMQDLFIYPNLYFQFLLKRFKMLQVGWLKATPGSNVLTQQMQPSLIWWLSAVQCYCAADQSSQQVNYIKAKVFPDSVIQHVSNDKLYRLSNCIFNLFAHGEFVLTLMSNTFLYLEKLMTCYPLKRYHDHWPGQFMAVFFRTIATVIQLPNILFLSFFSHMLMIRTLVKQAKDFNRTTKQASAEPPNLKAGSTADGSTADGSTESGVPSMPSKMTPASMSAPSLSVSSPRSQPASPRRATEPAGASAQVRFFTNDLSGILFSADNLPELYTSVSGYSEQTVEMSRV